jgi:hypothetical protein
VTALTFAAVYVMIVLVGTAVTEQIDVLRIAQRRSSCVDCITQDPVNRLVQTAFRSGAQRIGQPIGTQPGFVKNLVGVNVADSGDHVLVEQQGLDLTPPTPHQGAEIRQLEPLRDRVNTKPCEVGHLDRDIRRIEYNDLAECSRIDEPHLFVVVEMHDYVRVQGANRASIDHQDLTAHTEVNHQLLTGIERHQEILATAVGSLDPGTRQPMDHSLGRCTTDCALATDLDAVDSTTDDETFQPPSHRLDLWQLRHTRFFGGLQVSVRWMNAAVAAACSAAFFDRPSPSPTISLATSTRAKNRLS